ncbi:NADP-dependent oxidoreductase domain-containing protein [Mycena alexandri]|uniref:NADP-dependent oxidoreductase domain-containing protein n=1 Tax=Mycena alexandri TaxID=1745969 RepID=A0AAD6SCW7_9AGAR|nr:NADP-dependent oxidoreductase domain-containing protein [Mycena alexandri]
MATTPKMQYVRLGTSGLKISKIILGCMSYGDPNWSGELATMQINTFDTANVYSNGLSEEHNLPRDEIVVMTKVFFTVSKNNTSEALYNDPTLDSQGYTNQYGLNRKHIFDSVKHSLRRLGLESIDVLQCHRFDPNTPIAETMQALHDVVNAGYVRYVGSLLAMLGSNQYSLPLQRGGAGDVPTLKHLGVGAIPWSPLSRGALSRPLAQQTKRGESDILPSNFYLKSDASVSAPIVGTTSLANLADIIGAIKVKLTEEEIKYLEEPYQPLVIFGHQ